MGNGVPGTWTTWTTDEERVRAIAVTDGEPRSARGIAAAAVVGTDRTRKILNDLVENGVVAKAERNGYTRYPVDRDHIAREATRVRRETDDRDELLERQESMTDRLTDVKDPTVERLVVHHLTIVGKALRQDRNE